MSARHSNATPLTIHIYAEKNFDEPKDFDSKIETSKGKADIDIGKEFRNKLFRFKILRALVPRY